MTTIIQGAKGALIENPVEPGKYDASPLADCLLIPMGYDPQLISAADIQHDGQIWTVDRDPRSCAHAASDAYQRVCDYLGLDCQEQETAILSADSACLPLEAREVKAGDNSNPSSRYYLWLIGQVLEADNG